MNTLAISFTIDPRLWAFKFSHYGKLMPGFTFGPFMVWIFQRLAK